ncbi:MAG: hypothetical protein LBM60_09720, partial [Clostridium sp.]|nr:hypothetical protein [Clostridium sp.]
MPSWAEGESLKVKELSNSLIGTRAGGAQTGASMKIENEKNAAKGKFTPIFLGNKRTWSRILSILLVVFMVLSDNSLQVVYAAADTFLDA